MTAVLSATVLIGVLAGCSSTAANEGADDVSPSVTTEPSVTEEPSVAAEPSTTAPPEEPEFGSGEYALSATSGGVTGGDTLTISGAALERVSTVRFGETEAVDLDQESDGSLAVTIPASVDYQRATVPVTLHGGNEVVKAGEYEYTVESGTDRQMEYLFTYWEDYNTAEWGNLNDVGGDCANFTNQGLIARGWEMTPDWFSRDQSSDRSASWGYTPSLDAWFEANADDLGATRLGIDDVDQLMVGDIGMFDWQPNGSPDHVMTVSKVEEVDGETKVYFVSHNNDGDYRDLDAVLGPEHPTGTAWFWSLSD